MSWPAGGEIEPFCGIEQPQKAGLVPNAVPHHGVTEIEHQLLIRRVVAQDAAGRAARIAQRRFGVVVLIAKDELVPHRRAAAQLGDVKLVSVQVVLIARGTSLERMVFVVSQVKVTRRIFGEAQQLVAIDAAGGRGGAAERRIDV
jgi:hypothetical protein